MVQRRLGSSRATLEWGDVLELQGLTRRYGDLVALDNLSFAVAEGQRFGFVGPNGAGRTTAMRIVLGVLEADAGQVFWRGSPIDEQTRRRTGYMPEDHGQTSSTQFARARSEPPESVS
jgi:ABC-2 type transport system ATP-binding protein